MPNLALPVVVVRNQPRATRSLVRYPAPLLTGIVDLQKGKPSESSVSIRCICHRRAQTSPVSCTWCKPPAGAECRTVTAVEVGGQGRQGL